MKHVTTLVDALPRSAIALLALPIFALAIGCGPSASTANNERDNDEKETSFSEAEKLENEKENRTLHVKITGNVNYEGDMHANSSFMINKAGQLVGFGVSGSIDTKSLDCQVGFNCLQPLEGIATPVLLSAGQEVKATLLNGASGSLTVYLPEETSDGSRKRDNYNALGDALCYSSDIKGGQTFLTLRIEKAERLKTDNTFPEQPQYTYRIKGTASYNATAARGESSLEHWGDIQKRKEQGITPICDPSWVDAVRVHVEMSFDFEATGLDYDALMKMRGGK